MQKNIKVNKEQAIKNLEDYLGCKWNDGFVNDLYMEAKAEKDTKALQLIDDYLSALELEESVEEDDSSRWISPDCEWFIENYDDSVRGVVE